FYTDAFPILKKHNIKAVNYVVYNFTGRLNHMKKHQIEEIVKSGLVEIGAHTLNHAWLIGAEESAAYNEIALCKEYLEKDYGVEVNSFAYPYGAHDGTVIGLVKKAGYTTAVLAKEGEENVIVLREGLLEIPRIRPGHTSGTSLLKIVKDM
ncbi:polysaccharide deacetylase family protein, partial [bacterium]|nr:polysaccharide deacetylase family protein [bacterium]